MLHGCGLKLTSTLPSDVEQLANGLERDASPFGHLQRTRPRHLLDLRRAVQIEEIGKVELQATRAWIYAKE